MKPVSESDIVNVGQLFYSPNMNKWDGVKRKYHPLGIPDKVSGMRTAGISGYKN
ncbi:hypothetical protein [Ohtaekwangia koreensis]|uniref:hypothetical protein n=1 Tax=Ohtaekwangia koreensis TaxID=688867 RepID=UPI00135646F8|nr:hypothetical protein [Ohtaekwangia koreensis]